MCQRLLTHFCFCCNDPACMTSKAHLQFQGNQTRIGVRKSNVFFFFSLPLCLVWSHWLTGDCVQRPRTRPFKPESHKGKGCADLCLTYRELRCRLRAEGAHKLVIQDGGGGPCAEMLCLPCVANWSLGSTAVLAWQELHPHFSPLMIKFSLVFIKMCFSPVAQLCPTLQPHTRLPCPSPNPRACSNSFPSSR